MKTKKEIKQRIQELEDEYKILSLEPTVSISKIDKLFRIQYDIDVLRWVLK
jgi:hypothetical protein